MLDRVLEPEVMDSVEEARDYDSMDHRDVNERFVADFLAFLRGTDCQSVLPCTNVLDVGTGTAQIPIELCRRCPGVQVVAVDAAQHMIDLGSDNVRRADLAQRIRLELCDAKRMPFTDASFDAVISNSIVHHIPQPRHVLSEIVRVAKAAAAIFIRDLARPADVATLRRLVDQYAGDGNEHQRRMFADSLHAALRVEEMRDLVGAVGFAPDCVQMTSDRHWTWAAVKP